VYASAVASAHVQPRPGAIHHLALRVSDPVRSLAFYGGVLGLVEMRRFEDGGVVRSIWLDAGGVVLMLERTLKGGGGDSGSGHVLAFSVDALRSWEQHLEERGIPVTDRTASTLYVSDPDGHRLGLTVFGR
jgi:catechol 2,3-dioxygenase-like lactoylglutathione lyase family enzyme